MYEKEMFFEHNFNSCTLRTLDKFLCKRLPFPSLSYSFTPYSFTPPMVRPATKYL